MHGLERRLVPSQATMGTLDPERRCAYVTFITTDSWLIAAELMMHSLRKTGTRHDRVVLVTEGVSQASRSKLEALGLIVKGVKTLVPEKLPLDVQHVATWTELGYTKLQVWGLTEYDQLLYIGV